jgi:hypothetical protein
MRNCDRTHNPTLTNKTLFHPQRLAAQNAQGVSREKRIYIGRISIRGGWKIRANAATTAAPGF